MSEQSSEQQGNGEGQQPQEGEGQQPEGKTFDAAYVEKLRRESAKYRTEAKANADAAKRLAELEDAQKSEADKVAERLTAAEQRATDAESALWRAQIALDKGLTPGQAKRLVGATREELEADADELLKDLGGRRKQGNHVPREGNSSSTPPNEERTAVRTLFGTG